MNFLERRNLLRYTCSRSTEDLLLVWTQRRLRVRAVATKKKLVRPKYDITKNGPYTWGNFHACAITKFEKPQQLGRACSSVTTCAAASRASPSPVSAGCCCMQAAAETTASGSTGKEDLKADRRVRHYKEVGLPEWPLAGRATVPRGLWYRSLHVSSSERFFQKVYGRPAPVDLTIHTFRTVDRTAGRRF